MHGRSDAPLQQLAFIPGNGPMAALIRTHDWSATPLGPAQSWPQALRTLVSVMLGSNQPMFIAWGGEQVLLYNDAYAEILALKHPSALGRPFLDVWDEIRSDLLPIVEQAYAGEPVHMDDIELLMHRRGYPEETHFAFSYTPVRDESGRIAGIFCPCTEITGQVIAERRRQEAEAALRAERDRTRRVLDGMAEGFGLLDREFRIIDINAEGLRLEQRPREAFLGKTHWEAWPGSEESELGRLLKRAMAERVPITLEHRYVWPDDHVAWLEMRAYPVDDGLAVFWRDVTGRKADEEALRASEERFRLMADAVPQIVWITDADGRTEFFNGQWSDYTGADYEPTTASAVATNFVHPDDAAGTMAAFEEARRTGGTFLVEHRIRSRTGEYRWFLVRGEPDHDPVTGAVVRWFGASVDIHDRRLVEEALRESEARLRALNDTLELQVSERTAERDRMWDTSPDLMLVIDFEGVFRRVNPAWTTLLGYTPDELVGHHVNEFVIPDDHAPTVDAYELAADGGRPTIQNRYRHKDGSIRWISWVAAPAAGVTYATGRDITAEKAKQAELEAAQEALRQSQKMEAMGQLTGGVAHDFNNLLTPIIGSLDMLTRRAVGTERERRLIGGALQSAERAKTLVQRLLAFARRQPLQPVAVDLGSLVDSMTGLIGSTLGPQIDVRVELEPELPPAIADPNQLEMALLNLAVNARDAMPDGGTLTIRTARGSVGGEHRGLRPGSYVCLSVVDTGIGMDEVTRARAVEPFFSTKGIGKGTGLGLSMVHGLAAQLGGGLTLESAPGKGTGVELWLPVSFAPVEEDGSDAYRTQPQPARGMALLVDDEDLVRMSTADMLMDLGYEVTEAGSAEEALRFLSSGMMPDLLVTDHLMPGMSGVELARQVRVLRPSLPVLIVSGYAEVDGVAPDLPRLTKPFRNAELAQSLAALMPARDR